MQTDLNSVWIWYATSIMNEGSAVNILQRREQRLSDWYQSSLGQMLAEQEQQALDEILPDLFGYHLLQLGASTPSLLSSSRILHKVALDSWPANMGLVSQMLGTPEHLPIQADCIDAVVLRHSLDMALDPRQVLREAERILVPEGHLIIMGFNPRSMWGIRRYLNFRSQEAPWADRFLSVHRIKDWLALLGMEVTNIQYRFFRPPVGRARVADRLLFLEDWGQRWWPFLGGSYILLAKKKVSTLTPIKPRWRPRRSVVSSLSDAASRSSEKHVNG